MEPQNCTLLISSNVSLYLFEGSRADEDSSMASLVFPTGLDGLNTQTQTRVRGLLSTELTWRKDSDVKSLNRRGLPIRKHAFLRSHSHSHTLSHAFECIHAQWTVKGLSKHRQAKDQTREREKKVREGSGVSAQNFKKNINNHIFKSEIETAFF